jgi:hypothetical protein
MYGGNVMGNRPKLKVKDHKVHAQMRVVFCNGTEFADEGPRMPSKEAQRGVAIVQKMWETEREELAEEFFSRTEEDTEKDEEGNPFHPIRMVFETRDTKEDPWVQIWLGEATCSHQEQGA